MGAIGDETSLAILNEFLQDASPDVSQTCELAIEKIQFDSNASTSEIKGSIYHSIDPAPPAFEDLPVDELKRILLDSTLPLFKRYRAMFGLRNKNSTESVLVSWLLIKAKQQALAEGLEDSSALFRHEIAFIFGQMQHPASVPALIKSLSKEGEAAMVRHESAEALGSIATPEVLEVLKKFSKDPEQVVRESCIVALDMYEYENSDQFQYAHVV